MRIAIDLTNSPHVPIFVPIIGRLRGAGHEVVVTARRFAQTVELAALAGLDVEVIGQHGGGSRMGKARTAISRTRSLKRLLGAMHRRQPFDVAWSHGSTDLPYVCRRLDIPHITMFDYEWASTMHRLNCASSWRVLVPESIPVERLTPYRVAGKLARYPGLKEEYYLADASLDATERDRLGVPPGDLLAVLRPPPDLALYHRGHSGDAFGAALERIAATEHATVVVLPRTEQQRAGIIERYGSDGARGVIVPAHAVDAASLMAGSDLVISAGGTMNREAAALGVPVYTVFAGRMGGVDEQLIADGRLHHLTTAADIPVERRDRTASDSAHVWRDPQVLIDLAFAGLPGRAEPVLAAT